VTRIARSVAAAFLAALPAVAVAQEVKSDAGKPTRPSIYDAKADATEQVRRATALAQRDGRRVLLMFGGDWCGWCHKLHALFASDPAIRRVLSDEYILVMVDTQAPHAEELLAECRGDLTSIGYPFLAVLDGDGKVVTRQRTNSLEEGDHHDPARVKEFLDQWVAPKPSAATVLANGLAKAASEDKLVFLHFGSPTCGWCRKLDDFLAREDTAPIIGRDFVDLKLDLSRMTGTDAILKRYNADQSSGIPWFVFLDAKGNPIVTSDGPKGNIGYPALPEEIGHFIGMLRKAARRMEPAQIGAVEEALKAEAKIEAARTGVNR
jgi:uncharacterized protein YyaL (SSP411 family)